MSHSYRISVPINIALSDTFREKIKSYKIDFTLLEILPKDTMLEMLKSKLLSKGFKETEKGLETSDYLGDTATFNLDTMQLNVSLNLPKNHEFFLVDDSNFDQMLESIISNCIKSEVPLPVDISRNLGKEYAKRITEVAIENKKIINNALKEIYKEAVIIKAKELGNLVNISESESGGNYRVHIEIHN